MSAAKWSRNIIALLTLALVASACESLVVWRIGNLRNNAGVAPVIDDAWLDARAEAWTNAMCAAGAVSDPPAGWFDGVSQEAVSVLTGRALETNEVKGTNLVFDGWKSDAIIVDPAITRIGVGTVVCPDGYVYVTQAHLDGPDLPEEGRYVDAVFATGDVAVDAVVDGNALDHSGSPVDLVLDLYTPEPDPRTVRPAIVLIHDGGFSSGSRADVAVEALSYAQRGFVVAAIDHRLDPAGLTGGWQPAIDAIDDAMEAVRWLRNFSGERGVDPARIASVGIGSGGVVSLALSTADDFVPGGPYAGLSPKVDAAIATGAEITDELNDLTIEADAADAPAMVFFHETDTVEGITSAVALETCTSLQTAGVDCDFVELAGSGHGSDVSAGGAQWDDHIGPFLHHQLDLASALPLVLDTFSVPDGPLVATETGQSWQTRAGAFSVASQAAVAGSGYNLVTVDAGRADVTSSVVVETVDTEFWLVVRASDGANYWRFGRAGGGDYQLQSIVGNSVGATPTVSTVVTPAPGDLVQCASAPGRLACDVNGVEVVSTTDPFNETATESGLAAYNSPGFRADAVTVDVSLLPLIPDIPTPTTLVADTFTRADGPLGSTETAQPWSVDSGTWSVADLAATPGPGYSLATLDAGQAELTTSMTVDALADDFWLVVRGSDANNHWRFGRTGGGDYELQQLIGGFPGSPLIDVAQTLAPQPGDVVSCTSTAALLSCAVDGSEVASSADTFNNSATRIGIAAFDGQALVVDDVLADPAAPTPPTPTTLVADTFTRLDGPVLGSAETGQPWTADIGSWSVTGTAAVPSPGAALATLDAGQSDLVTEVDVTTLADEFWLIVRGSDADNHWRFGRIADGDYVLQDIVGGAVGGAPVTTVNVVTPTAGDRLRCASDVGELTCSVGGTVVATTTDSFNEAATRVGLASGGAATPTFDDFTADPTNPPPPSYAVVVDTFDRPDSPTLGTADSGQTWTNESGSWGVAANEAVPGGGYSLVSIDAGRDDLHTEARFTALGDEMWLVVRASDSQNYWRFGRTGGGDYTLQQVIGGLLGSPAVTVLQNVTPAVDDLVACRSSSAALTCSVNGVDAVTTADSFNVDATRLGLAAYNATIDAVDDVLAIPADLLVADTFTRADASVLGSAETGQPWTVPAGSWGVTSSVATPGAAPSVALVDPGATDLRAEFTLTTPDTEFWLLVRATDDTRHWRFGRAGGGDYTLEKVDAGAVSAPGVSLTQNLTPSAGDRVACRSVASGITCWVDDVEIASTEDAFDAGVAPVGMAAAGATTLQLDDVLVSAAADPGAPPPDPSLVRDTFSRADGPSLGEADSGQTWAEESGSWSIAAGEAAPGGGAAVATIDAGASEVVAGLTVPTLDADFWMLVRATDAANHWRFGRTAGGDYTLESVQAGVASAPGVTYSQTLAPAPGDALSCVTTAVALTCRVNGTDVATTADGFGAAATRVGMAANGATTLRFDEVDVDPAPPAPPVGVALVDDFARPDGPLGSTPGGIPWTVHAGSFEIQSGNALATSAGFNLASVDAGAMGGTYEIVLPDTGGRFWATFRVQDAANYYRFGPDPLTGFYTLEKVVNGVPSLLDFRFGRRNATAAPGDTIRIVQRDDDSVFVAVNGDHVVDAGDMALLGVSGVGFAMENAGNATVSALWYDPVTSTYVVDDSFDRPDSATPGPPDSGVRYPWTNWYGPQWEIVGNQLRHPGTSYGVVMLDTSSESADFSATVAALADDEHYLIFRVKEDGSHFRFGVDDGGYVLEAVTGWVFGAAVPGLVTHASPIPAAGQELAIEQDLDGSIRAYVDGALVFSFVDTTTNPQGGHYGFATVGGLARFDDVHLVPEIP